MKKNIFLSIFSGLLLWIAWPPTPFTSFLLFVGFVPMLVAVENIIQSDLTKKGKKIFGTTFLGCFVWNTLCVYWVFNSISTEGTIAAIPISMIVYSLSPLLMAFAFWLYYKLRTVTKRQWALIGLVCFWTGYEYLVQTWDLKFPWMTLGNGFAVSHQLIQWYEYTGVYGGTVWIWAANILAFLIYIGLREAQASQLRLRLIIALVLVIVLPIAISLNTYYNYQEQNDPSNIVIAQPNIDPILKEGENQMPPAQQIDILTHLSDSIGQKNTEFFLWPETAIEDYVDEGHIRSSNYFLQVQHFLYKYKNGNVLTGMEGYRVFDTQKSATARKIPNSNMYEENYNSAVNIENSAEVQFYHKSKFVPGVESIPFGGALAFMIPLFEHFGGATGSYTPQDEAGVLYSQSGIGVDPSICYESIWGDYVAQSVKKGAQFIAVITNDGWFGNSSGKDQHLDYAKLRAIETRRWVAQSANTGISAFINQRGDVVQQTKWWVRTAIKHDINLNTEITFYVQNGDLIAKIGCVLAGIGVIWILVGVVLGRRKTAS